MIDFKVLIARDEVWKIGLDFLSYKMDLMNLR